MTEKPVHGWHFISDTGYLGYDMIDIRAYPGLTLKVKPPIEVCKRGLHASRRLIDALMNAPGPILCRVLVSGEIQERHDKLAGSERTILWMINAEPVFKAFLLDLIDSASSDMYACTAFARISDFMSYDYYDSIGNYFLTNLIRDGFDFGWMRALQEELRNWRSSYVLRNKNDFGLLSSSPWSQEASDAFNANLENYVDKAHYQGLVLHNKP